MAALLQPQPVPRRRETRPYEIPEIPPARAADSPLVAARSRWRPVYEFDELDRSVVFNDCRFISAERGMAAGLVTNHRNGSSEGFAILTRNGGEQWTPIKIKDNPLSLFWGPNASLWMVGEDDLWFSSEAGLTWEKRKLPSRSRIIRVYFLDDQQGWAFGIGKRFFSTLDGGRNWKPAAESEALQLQDQTTSWAAMQFISKEIGLLVGNYVPPRRERQRFPDWMTPEEAAKRRLTPTTTLAAETRDGGKTWSIQRASAFGNAVRLRTFGTRGLIVYQYSNNFEFPSEVVEVDFSTGQNRPIFRRKDTVIYDAIPLPEGGVVLAGLNVPPAMAFLPVSRPVTILWSDNNKDWIRQRVHYRASGKRVILSSISSSCIWCATDEGMVLKLVKEN
jgi:hypothetical protein